MVLGRPSPVRITSGDVIRDYIKVEVQQFLAFLIVKVKGISGVCQEFL